MPGAMDNAHISRSASQPQTPAPESLPEEPTNSAEPEKSNGTHPGAQAQAGTPEGGAFPSRRRRFVRVRAPLVQTAAAVERSQVAELLPQAGHGLPVASHPPRNRRHVLFSCLISAFCHGLLLVVLSLWILNTPRGLGPIDLLGTTEAPRALEGLQTEILLPASPSMQTVLQPREFISERTKVSTLESATSESTGEQPSETVPEQVGDPATPWGLAVSQLLESTLRPIGGGLEGRSAEMRAKLAADGGGTARSEEAVERGLRWLAAHQNSDGSWTFDLKNGVCKGQCRNPGSEPSTCAATALAILPFLGAGYTHQGGIYDKTLQRGFYYLLRRGRTTENGLDFQEAVKNGMYAQGLVAIALCEGYAMTRDPALKDPAQQAIQFIEFAQDRNGGGWRYRPHEPGDTTVTGWQLMALKSAEMAGLKVNRSVIYSAQHFLDTVASDGGAQYGYQTPEPRRSTTAIGLLCRMYSGWVRSHPALMRGVSHLDLWGPSAIDIYYNYYASQVLRHWGGSEWKRWNDALREALIASQASKGHEAGSWYFDDEHSRVGGRLYTTAMAIMILEVYYRYLPLYSKPVFPDL